MKFGSLAVAISVFALLGAGAASAQQAWPSKPVHWIVPYAAGGFADIRARKIGVELAKALGQPIVIENRTGAGGVLGTDVVAKAAPDGYTMGMGNLAPLAVNVSLMKKLPYDPQKDLSPVILVETSPLILTAGPGLQAKSVQELIALAKARPGQLAFASSGVGGAHHLSGEMLRQASGIDIVHVAYKGGAPAAADVLAGHGLRGAAVDQGGQDTRACGDLRQTLIHPARSADHDGSRRAGLRVVQLARRDRARRNAAGNRRAAEPRTERDSRPTAHA
jgi:tripartite-type tricarboxylate transporter receptor subunit TctC